MQDVRLKEIANELEYGDSEKFSLLDGLVYKKDEDRVRFAIPDSMINNIIRIYHDDMAHCGFEKTYQGVHGTYWFPAMRKRIRDYLDNCVTCLMANSSSHRFEGQSQIESPPKLPFEIMHVDHFGPLQETVNGFKHIFVVIDAFTRFTWLFPTRTTNSKEVYNDLKFLFNVFGNPTTLVSPWYSIHIERIR